MNIQILKHVDFLNEIIKLMIINDMYTFNNRSYGLFVENLVLKSFFMINGDNVVLINTLCILTVQCQVDMQ